MHAAASASLRTSASVAMKRDFFTMYSVSVRPYTDVIKEVVIDNLSFALYFSLIISHLAAFDKGEALFPHRQVFDVQQRFDGLLLRLRQGVDRPDDAAVLFGNRSAVLTVRFVFLIILTEHSRPATKMQIRDLEKVGHSQQYGNVRGIQARLP